MNHLRTSQHSSSFTSLYLIFSLMIGPLGCSDPVPTQGSAELEAFFSDSSGPPEPMAQDQAMRGKADVIALPAISITVWAVGALIVYMGGQTIFTNTIEDFETVLRAALGQSADWDWAEQYNEPVEQAQHLTEQLNRIAYRSESSSFYSINGNDYLRFLSMASPITVLDPKKLRDLVDGKIRPWDQYAREYFKALQLASVQARRIELDEAANGLCIRATVYSRDTAAIPYLGMARSRGPVDVVPAAVFASVKATMRCGMYDTNIREFIYSYYDVNGPVSQLPDIFIAHILKTARLIYKYVETCQMPPSVEVVPDEGDCHDVTLH